MHARPFPQIATLTALCMIAADDMMVVAQLGQSLDGRIATSSGHSHYVNGPEAIRLLHALRAAVDAVVVGAGTAAEDDPQLTVRHVAGRNPARVLIDVTRRAGPDLKMLRDDGVRRIVFGAPLLADPAGVETVLCERPVAPAFVLDALKARGLRRVLIEGGAMTVSRFLEAGALDRLCVLVAPLLIGSGRPGLSLAPIETLHAARRPVTEITALPGGDVVFDCDLRNAVPGA